MVDMWGATDDRTAPSAVEADVEKLKMALAEAGYPQPTLILQDDGWFTSWDGHPPVEAIWRAMSLVFPDTVSCFRCWNDASDPDGTECRGIGTPTEDCGRLG